MTKTEAAVNASTFASLKNVALAMKTMDRIVNRSHNLPGMAVMFSESGLGKSMAASAVATRYRGVYVECKSYFTKKSFLMAILDEMALRPGRTIYEMVNQIAEELALSRRPLLVDEADYLADRNVIDLVRDIYEASSAPILLIGEEGFPKKLKRWERFHNRILEWQPAIPADMEDARKLARLYSPEISIADPLLELMVGATRGVTRRIVVNIDTARLEAEKAGAKVADIKLWGHRSFYTGEAPLIRRGA